MSGKSPSKLSVRGYLAESSGIPIFSQLRVIAKLMLGLRDEIEVHLTAEEVGTIFESYLARRIIGPLMWRKHIEFEGADALLWVRKGSSGLYTVRIKTYVPPTWGIRATVSIDGHGTYCKMRVEVKCMRRQAVACLGGLLAPCVLLPMAIVSVVEGRFADSVLMSIPMIMFFVLFVWSVDGMRLNTKVIWNWLGGIEHSSR